MRAVLIAVAVLLALSIAVRADDAPWKAGVATVTVTPEGSLWMAGYASRKKPAEGKATDLFAKALALEDAKGRRLVIVTTDLIGIPRPLRDAVARRVTEQHKLPPESLLLNASHTHCGPVVRLTRSSLYDLDGEQAEAVRTYVAGLEDKLVDVVGQALQKLAPAKLSYSHARAGFAMNRRLPTDKGPQNSPYPEGPVDHDVPVLRVESPDGRELRAVLFGYACHNTTLSFFQYCGDYAGFAQQELEAAHPGTTALFLMGCGGDQNPYPRGTIEHCRTHGKTLATAVEAALLPEPKPLRGPLSTALEEVTLEFQPPPGREELVRMTQSPNLFEQKRGKLMLEDLDAGNVPGTDYAYPIQVIRFGRDLTLIAMAGEVVVDYSLRFKRELSGPDAPILWVAGYSNDVFGYVPSLRVLKEGGYEGGGAMLYTSLPGPFAPSVEERIVERVHKMAK